MSVANSAIMHFRTFLRDCSLQCFEAMTQSKGEVRVVPCGAVCRQYVSGPVSGGSAVDWARKGTGATSICPFSPRCSVRNYGGLRGSEVLQQRMRKIKPRHSRGIGVQ